MSVSFTLDPDFGFVILSVVANLFLNYYLGHLVGVSRKKNKIALPLMYDCKQPSNPFNFVQRGHQNFLETNYLIVLMLLIGGIQRPIIASITNIVYCVGRIFYAKGYATGDAKNRSRGSFQYLAVITFLILTIEFAYTLLSAKYLE